MSDADYFNNPEVSIKSKSNVGTPSPVLGNAAEAKAESDNSEDLLLLNFEDSPKPKPDTNSNKLPVQQNTKLPLPSRREKVNPVPNWSDVCEALVLAQQKPFLHPVITHYAPLIKKGYAAHEKGLTYEEYAFEMTEKQLQVLRGKDLSNAPIFKFDISKSKLVRERTRRLESVNIEKSLVSSKEGMNIEDDILRRQLNDGNVGNISTPSTTPEAKRRKTNDLSEERIQVSSWVASDNLSEESSQPPLTAREHESRRNSFPASLYHPTNPGCFIQYRYPTTNYPIDNPSLLEPTNGADIGGTWTEAGTRMATPPRHRSLPNNFHGISIN